MVLGELLREHATRTPEKLAVVDVSTDISLSYGELNARVNSLANALTDGGLRKGDRVAIAQHNCLEYIETFFAAMKLGAVLTTIDFRAAPREMEYMLENSGAAALLIGENYRNALDSMGHGLKAVTNYICIGKGCEDIPKYEKLLAHYPSTEPDTIVDESDLATLFYTSGTTGQPKGVMMTHKNLAAAMMNMLKALPLTSDDVTLHTSPFSHIASTWPLLDHVCAGGTNVTIDKFDPATVLEAIEKHRITTWNTVPTVILRLAEFPELTNYNLTSLRWIGYGASPMPVEVLKKAIGLLGNVFVQVYGSTETYIVTVLPREDHVVDGPEEKVKKLRSCGRPVDGLEVRVVDSKNKDIAPDGTGEIIVKGDSVTPGYWKLPEETAGTIKQGWYYSGDLASVDSDGYLYIVDRKKELIISGGENISPKEVEEVIYRHPAIYEAAVIGVPDEKWGEAARAVVSLKEGMKATEEEIIAFCKQNLARFKAPKSVVIIDSLPKTASGKISRKEIKDRFRGQ